jgi:hypothetical protein
MLLNNIPSVSIFRLIDPIATSLGWNETSEDKTSHHGRGILRSEVLSEAVALGSQDFVAKALEYFYSIKNASIEAGLYDTRQTSDFDFSSIQSRLNLSPDLLNVVWDAGVIWGHEDDYDFVLKAYEKATFAVDKVRLIHALASTRRPEKVWQTLSLALTDKVKKQDVTT